MLRQISAGAIPAFYTVGDVCLRDHDKGAPKCVMVGTMAAIADRQGARRYVGFSPHPEAITPMFDGDLTYDAVLWTANRKQTETEAEREKPLP